MNLNWARIKLREKENQLSSRYDRGPLNSIIILWKRHNISERYYFGMRKHIEVEYWGREGRGGAILQGTIQFFFGEASLLKTLASLKKHGAHNPIWEQKSHPETTIVGFLESTSKQYYSVSQRLIVFQLRAVHKDSYYFKTEFQQFLRTMKITRNR